VSAWHTLVDSDSFRWFAKRGPGRPLFRSRAFRRAMVERNRVIADRASRADPGLFAGVKTFCFFVGHNKSGTSLLGGLLDAHSRIVLADEADALRYVEARVGREQLFHILLRSSRTEARKGRVTGRRLEPYSYFVRGQSQGLSDCALVVGDSTSGTSTRRLGRRPELLDRLRGFGIDVKVIQVIRNPFDPIAAMTVRSGRSVDEAIARYFAACEALQRIRQQVPVADLFPVRYESVVAEPATALRRACAFVGVDATPAYLEACSAIIRPRPDRSRERIVWSPSQIAAVERGVAEFDFLAGYSYAT
jgi:hypothetical protein